MLEAAIVVGVGASQGVGAAVSRRLAREGKSVFIVGRTEERLEAVAAEIRESGGACTAVAADATRSPDVARVFETVQRDSGGPPRIVIYNAGNNYPKDLLDLTDEEFESSWRVCGFGAFLIAREVARRMVPAGGGTVIFTGATASVRSRPRISSRLGASIFARMVAKASIRTCTPSVGRVVPRKPKRTVDGVC